MNAKVLSDLRKWKKIGRKENIMWIKCEERLPETIKTYSEWRDGKDYVVAIAYDCPDNTFHYQSIRWCNGWNCSMNPDGTIDREHEFKDVVAWFEIPEFKG